MGAEFTESHFYIYWDDHMFFNFQFINMKYHIDWYAYIEESLHPWDKPNLIMMDMLFDVLLMVTAAMKLKDSYSLEEKLWPT